MNLGRPHLTARVPTYPRFSRSVVWIKALVVPLYAPRSPPAITLFIVAVDIYTVKTHIIRRFAHVFIETFKSFPFTAIGDSFSCVVRKYLRQVGTTPTLHPFPYLICPSIRHPVCFSTLLPHTAARCCVSTGQVVCPYKG